jgi:hypothetical protein
MYPDSPISLSDIRQSRADSLDMGISPDEVPSPRSRPRSFSSPYRSNMAVPELLIDRIDSSSRLEPAFGSESNSSQLPPPLPVPSIIVDTTNPSSPFEPAPLTEGRAYAASLPPSASPRLDFPDIEPDPFCSCGASAIDQASFRASPASVAGLPPSSARSSWSKFKMKFSSRPPTEISLTSILRPSDSSDPLAQLELVDSKGQNITHSNMLETRAKICKQLHFMFIYPVAYIAMWIVPLVAHCFQYSDQYANEPPYALNAVMTIILTSQCTVDCLLFSIKEKPWRHLRENRKTICRGWAYLKDLTLGRRRSSQSYTRRGPGKSAAAMAADARLAYRRRDDENAARASETDKQERRRRGERSWWDDEEGTGTGMTTPLTTLVENPMSLLDGAMSRSTDVMDFAQPVSERETT